MSVENNFNQQSSGFLTSQDSDFIKKLMVKIQINASLKQAEHDPEDFLVWLMAWDSPKINLGTTEEKIAVCPDAGALIMRSIPGAHSHADNHFPEAMPKLISIASALSSQQVQGLRETRDPEKLQAIETYLQSKTSSGPSIAPAEEAMTSLEQALKARLRGALAQRYDKASASGSLAQHPDVLEKLMEEVAPGLKGSDLFKSLSSHLDDGPKGAG